jgi:hypothetical protein
MTAKYIVKAVTQTTSFRKNLKLRYGQNVSSYIKEVTAFLPAAIQFHY